MHRPRLRARATLVAWLLLTSCGDEPPPPPASVAKQSGDAQQSVAGQVVTTKPTVLVLDASGQPVANATVTFAVTSGGGSVAPATSLTDATGIASATAWTLGPKVGTNTMTATVTTLPAVTFTATGIAGAPAKSSKGAGDNQTGSINAPVLVKPKVVVMDANDNLVAGATVTFAVTAGGGTVTGAAQTTDAAGEATVGSWSLGPTTGAQTLSATVTGVPPLTFTVTAADPCSTVTPHTIGTTTSDALTAQDCRYSDGAFIDYYGISSSSNMSFRLIQRSSALNTLFRVFDGTGFNLGFANDSSSSNTNAHLRILAPAGQMKIGASASTSGATGTYTLESTQVSEAGAGICEVAFIAGPMTTSQTLSASDCRDDNFPADAFTFYAKAGVTYTFVQTTSSFDPWIAVRTTGGTQFSFSYSIGGAVPRKATITFTSNNGGVFAVFCEANTSSQSGAYTLSMTASGSGTAAGADAPQIIDIPRITSLLRGRPR